MRGDDGLFERLTLEAFQSGLSWLTILRKREASGPRSPASPSRRSRGFGDGDVDPAARRPRDRAQPGEDRRRDRQRARRGGTARRAGRAALVVRAAAAPRPAAGSPTCRRSRPSRPRWPRTLKRRGFRFVGPTTAYALMQATGMVDDHLAGCHVCQACADGWAAWRSGRWSPRRSGTRPSGCTPATRSTCPADQIWHRPHPAVGDPSLVAASAAGAGLVGAGADGERPAPRRRVAYTHRLLDDPRPAAG